LELGKKFRMRRVKLRKRRGNDLPRGTQRKRGRVRGEEKLRSEGRSLSQGPVATKVCCHQKSHLLCMKGGGEKTNQGRGLEGETREIIATQ